MANERKTEALVRKRLQRLGYFKDTNLIVEEQQSDNPRIAKLLKNASKKGAGQGYPEFIISSKEVSEFLIVIECKADPRKHASKSRDKYGEYAVDGVLLYASFLSKEFDVLAVAVSGATEAAFKISQHLHLRGAHAPVDVQDKDIRSFADSHNMVLRNPAKFRQDYDSLLAYSRELNEKLQAKKIQEAQRSMLVCGVLVALGNTPFVKSFKYYTTAKELADNLVSTVINEFKAANLPAERIASLEQAFAFIRVNAVLTTDKDFAVDLIEQIDKHVCTFVRTHKYYDAIGTFYVQFLRYANNDKGLGIVLTPPHIAELFAGLADVNKDSVVFDNCCGTAGLLIAAMREMLQDAGSDTPAEKAIKKRQLIGVEFQDNIYALAVSNMVVHGDGKTNILPGDCFALSAKVKEKWKPTVGLLNPPYKTKASPTEELDFVLNNLEALQTNGKCVAIIPVSCATGDTSEILERKRRLLEKHTLEAVMSMPVDLFHDSKAGVATCIMVVTAHKPHRRGKKTWFGYWRDDGLVKVKNKGRIDANNTWAVTKKRWLAGFRNREVATMGSVMQEVTAQDEWCAEAYMETDYSKMTREDFEQVVRNYGIFRLLGARLETADETSK
ncbi:MAG: N-6 DNA methylase [Candidatus Atribacteria bacterium]|nr:N-6 DNA methylase [Candidatus Atribacteria bacterium]